MKRILGICGSASENSSNLQLLQAMQREFGKQYDISIVDGLWKLPLFSPQLEQLAVPEDIIWLRQNVAESDAVVVVTPEYVHNIPAVLKNALEWLTHSGELADKPTLPITFAPISPRGEHAMRSLLASLQALKCNVVAELSLYQQPLRTAGGTIVLDSDTRLLLTEALAML